MLYSTSQCILIYRNPDIRAHKHERARIIICSRFLQSCPLVRMKFHKALEHDSLMKHTSILFRSSTIKGGTQNVREFVKNNAMMADMHELMNSISSKLDPMIVFLKLAWAYSFRDFVRGHRGTKTPKLLYFFFVKRPKRTSVEC